MGLEVIDRCKLPLRGTPSHHRRSRLAGFLENNMDLEEANMITSSSKNVWSMGKITDVMASGGATLLMVTSSIASPQS